MVAFGEGAVQETPALHYTGLLYNPFSNSELRTSLRTGERSEGSLERALLVLGFEYRSSGRGLICNFSPTGQKWAKFQPCQFSRGSPLAGSLLAQHDSILYFVLQKIYVIYEK